MNKFISICLSLVVLALFVDNISGSLPDYIKACSRSDPKLNECALRVAKESAKRFAKGDTSRGIPSLDPIRVKEIKTLGANSGPNQLKITLTDNVLTGPSNLEVTKMGLDVKKQKVSVHFFGDILLEAKYTMTGRILIIPLDGTGRARINLRDVKLQYLFDFDVVKGKDGKDYIKMKNDDLKYDIGKANFKLDNLFNGDKVLGETTNRLLNEQWRDLVGELAPPIVKEVRVAAKKTVQTFLSQVSYDELLLP